MSGLAANGGLHDRPILFRQFDGAIRPGARRNNRDRIDQILQAWWGLWKLRGDVSACLFDGVAARHDLPPALDAECDDKCRLSRWIERARKQHVGVQENPVHLRRLVFLAIAARSEPVNRSSLSQFAMSSSV